MSSIFTNPYEGKKPLAWSLQKCFLYAEGTQGGTLSSENGQGILAAAERVDVSYGRSLQKRYPLTSGSPITLLGVPQGSCTITTIIGPKHNVDQFLKLFGSTCNPFTLQIKTDAIDTGKEACQEDQIKNHLKLGGCMGNQLSFTLSTEGNIVTAQGVFQIQFDTLEWTND